MVGSSLPNHGICFISSLLNSALDFLHLFDKSKSAV